MYMYNVLKIYMYYKKNIGGLWPRPDPMRIRECFWLPIDFIDFIFETINDFHEMISYMIDISLSCYVLFIICDVNLNSSSTRL